MVDQTAQRRRRIMRWILAASLGLNLLFIGAFAGAAYRQAGGPGAPSGGDRAGMRGYAAPYMQALPRETRRAMFRALRDGGGGAAPFSRKARHALYQQMVTALRTTPFDPAAAQAILDVQRDAVVVAQSAAQAAWLSEVTQMAPQERAAYADTLEDVLTRRPRGPDRGKKRDN